MYGQIYVIIDLYSYLGEAALELNHHLYVQLPSPPTPPPVLTPPHKQGSNL